MGAKETLADLREFETGLSMYRARLEACWSREWVIPEEEKALVSTDRARLSRLYGGLRTAIAQAHGGAVPRFGYHTTDLGEIGQVALREPTDDSSVMDALDAAQQMAAQTIGYFDRIARDEPDPSMVPAAPVTQPPRPATARLPPAPVPPAPDAQREVPLHRETTSGEHWTSGRRYYADLLGQAIRMLWQRSNLVADVISVLVLIALVFNAEIANAIGALDWAGLPKATAIIPIIALVTDDLLVANHRNVRRLLTERADVAREREDARAEANRLDAALGVRRRDIEFAHRLNEKYVDGVHRILNHPFQSERAVALFQQMDEAWTQDVKNALNAHPCTPWEITRFEVLQEVPRDKHFHPGDPAWDDLKQKFNERLNRLRWLIERYGEKPPA